MSLLYIYLRTNWRIILLFSYNPRNSLDPQSRTPTRLHGVYAELIGEPLAPIPFLSLARTNAEFLTIRRILHTQKLGVSVNPTIIFAVIHWHWYASWIYFGVGRTGVSIIDVHGSKIYGGLNLMADSGSGVSVQVTVTPPRRERTGIICWWWGECCNARTSRAEENRWASWGEELERELWNTSSPGRSFFLFQVSGSSEEESVDNKNIFVLLFCDI